MTENGRFGACFFWRCNFPVPERFALCRDNAFIGIFTDHLDLPRGPPFHHLGVP